MPKKPFNIWLQYLAPQQILTMFAGKLGDNRHIWLKSALINYFIRRFNVDVTLAEPNDVSAYPTFNSFFTRALKASARPIAQEPDAIVSPADGTISQLGKINAGILFQAKGFHFTLNNLLGQNETLADIFHQGLFATIYLSPKDYHRVHMPVTGTLRKTIYIPGKLFSVNKNTANNVPNLFARNERLVCIFDTAAGPMGVILVGAMLVGSIATVWGEHPRGRKIVTDHYPAAGEGCVILERGATLGHFKMGSTVIVLFAKQNISWLTRFQENSTIHMGEIFGKISHS